MRIDADGDPGSSAGRQKIVTELDRSAGEPLVVYRQCPSYLVLSGEVSR